MQIPILNGIYTDGVSDFRTSYPRNLIPVPKQQGISEGYLRPADGIVDLGTGPGFDRGGINWRDICFRAMGSKLVAVYKNGGDANVLGEIGGYDAPVTFDYSFDKLAICSAGDLYYWDGSLTKVTDEDVGKVIDVVWVDGYFFLTDGQYLIVTELKDPTKVDPLKYGSAEADPDNIVGLLKLRNEVYVMGRYTVEVFQNVGGDYFPFERIEGAQMPRGSIGTHSNCVFMENIAFLGGGRNEKIAVWIGSNGTTQKLSTREIEQIVSEYSQSQLSNVVMEAKVGDGHQFLYIHLPDQTLVYDGAASQVVGEPVWFVLTSSLVGKSTYRARNFVWCYDQWMCGDPTSIHYGKLTDEISSHYGEDIGWDFATTILYNEGRGAILHELELVCLTGRPSASADPTIWTSYTTDGVTWSQERPRSLGKQGQRNKRISWLQQGFMRHWRVQKFRGTSDAHSSFARLEARIEGMNV